MRLGFDQGLTNWEIAQQGGSPERQGTVRPGSATLTEGDSFLVSLSHDFVVPEDALALSFTFDGPVFDTTDADSINDAFEVALLDSNGQPLVHAFAGQRDAFLNITEGLTPAMGSEATLTGGVLALTGNRVTVDLTSLFAGTAATVLFRLVNNDRDEATTVTIHSVEIHREQSDSAPTVSLALVNDTAPPGPAGVPYQTDLLTNDPRVQGVATDDGSIQLLQIQIGDGTFQDITASLVGGAFSFDPGVLAPGAHRLTVRATDDAGQASTAALEFRVNHPPTAVAGSDILINEGATAWFDGSDSSDADAAIFAAAWTFHDGATAPGETASRAYAQDGSYDVQLSVTDTAGSIATDTVRVQVANLAPVLAPIAAQRVSLGSTFDLLATFTDLGVLDTHTAAIDWGDGTTASLTVNQLSDVGTAFGQHRYALPGIYTATVSVTDDAGDSHSQSFLVTVDSAPAVELSLMNDTAPAGAAGAPYRTDRLTNDPRVQGTVSDDLGVTRLEVQINGGPFQDITASLVGGNFQFDPGLLAPGPHQITVRATDAAQQTSTAVLTFSVNQPPVAVAGDDQSISEGGAASFDGSGSTDAEAALFSTAWSFHDGSQAAGLTSVFTYLQDGLYQATLIVTDTAGSTATDTVQVHVNNVAPVVAPLADLHLLSGQPFNLLAPFSDAGVLDTHTAVVDWGDGSSEPLTISEANGAGSATGQHSYAAPGVYTVVVRVTDDAGDSHSQSLLVTVDGAPAVELSLISDTAPAGAAGAPYRTDRLTNDPRVQGTVSDDFGVTRLEIQVDDGAFQDITASLVEGSFQFDPGLLAFGPHQFTVRATDSVGQASSTSFQFRVNQPPTAVIGSDLTVSEGGTELFDALGSTDAEAAIFAAEWTFHDGSVVPGLNSSFRYPQDGSYDVLLTVTDTAGSIASQTAQVQVNNRPPEVMVRFTDHPKAGEAFDISARIMDMGVQDAHTATVDWGDGVAHSLPIDDSSGRRRAAGRHFYAQPGVYQVTVTVTDEAGGTAVNRFSVTVDARALTPVVAKDDGEWAYRERGVWQPRSAATAWQGDYRLQTPGIGSRTATWTLTAPAGDYEVLATWQAINTNASNAPFRILDGATLRGAVTVDQRFATAGAAFNGRAWQSLGTYRFSTGIATIELSDLANGNVVADGIILVPAATKFFVVDTAADTTFRYGSEGASVGSSLLGAGLTEPRGIASNIAGDRQWVIDQTTHQVTVFGPGGVRLGAWQAGDLTDPQDIATDGANIWIVDGSGRVLRYNGAATLTSGAASPSSSFTLDPTNISPTGIISDGSTIWITDDLTDEVFVYTIDGDFTGRWRLDPANADPSGITKDPSGGNDLWVVDRGDAVVYRYAASTSLRSGSAIATTAFALLDANASPEGIADPPVLSISNPANNLSVPAGQPLLITGQANDGASPAYPITVNSTPVEAIDASGQFFHPITPTVGVNTYTVQATAADGTTAAQTVTLTGTQLPPGQLDFSLFSDVTASFQPEYQRTSYNQDRTLLYAELAIRNAGQYSANAPLLVGVTNLSDPTVQVRNATGVTPEGMPYYDLSSLISGGSLATGALSSVATLAFDNPSGHQFTFDVVVLGQINQAPVIISSPDVEALAGRAYRYDIQATDANRDTISYALLTGPAGLQLNSTTGVLTWSPVTTDIGNHRVTIQAADSHGGIAEQSFILSVIEPPPNRPPVITSTPVVAASVGILYTYDVNARDVDGDILSYSLGPVAMPARAVAITNSSFEDQSLGEDGYTQGTLTGWTITPSHSGGVYNPGPSRYLGGDVADGLNVAWSYGGTISQMLSETLAANTRYTLEVAVGDRLDQTLPTFLIQLWAGNHLLAGSSSPRPGDGEFTTVTVDYHPIANDAAVGQPLMVQLVSEGQQANFDHVRLTAFEFRPSPSMTIDSSTGVITWTPTTEQLGTQEVAVTVSDGHDGFAVQPFTIRVGASAGNHAPVIITQPSAAVAGAPYTYEVAAVDPDQDALTYSLISGPAGMTVNAQSGVLTWPSPTTPASIHVQVSDGRGGVDQQVFVLNVGQAAGEIRGTKFHDVNGDGVRSVPRRIDFDSLAAGTRITDQWQAAGVVFESNLGQPASIIDALNEATSPRNILVGRDNFSDIFITFVDPATGNPSPEVNVHSGSFQVVSVGHAEITVIFKDSFGSLVGQTVLQHLDGPTNGFRNVDSVSIPLNTSRIEIVFTKSVGSEDGIGIDDLEFQLSPPEPGLPGWTIYLDQNGNSQRDLGEPYSVTDEEGEYVFSGLAPATYFVREEQKPGWMQTTRGNVGGLILNGDFEQTTSVDLPNGTKRYVGWTELSVEEGISGIFIEGANGLSSGDIRSTQLDGSTSAAPDPFFPYQSDSDSRHDHYAFARPSGPAPPTSYAELVSDPLVINGPITMDVWRESSGALSQVRFHDAQTHELLGSSVVSTDPRVWTRVVFDTSAFLGREAYIVLRGGTTQHLFGWLTLFDNIFGGTTVGTTDEQFGFAKQVDLLAGQVVSEIDFGNQFFGDATGLKFTTQPPASAVVDENLSYQARASSPGGGILSFDLPVKPKGMIVRPSSGAISWQPTADQVGVHEVLLRVQDGRGGVALQAFQITVAATNTAPIITSLPPAGVLRGQPFSYPVLAQDADGDTLTYRLDSGPEGMVIDPTTGVISWTPANSDDGREVVVKVEDGRGGRDEQRFTIDLTEAATDLTILDVDQSGLTFDGQRLTISGVISARIVNAATLPIATPFSVKFFEDRNGNNTFEPNADNVLGSTTITAPLAAAGSVLVSATLSGSALFTNNRIWVVVDSENVVEETNETNNLAVRLTEFIPTVGQFNPGIEWQLNSFATLPQSNQVIATPTVIDLDLDQVPDVVFSTNEGIAWTADGILRAVRGSTGQELWTITDPAHHVAPGGSIAVGNIDTDPNPEIVAIHESGALIAFNHDGTFLWKTAHVVPSLMSNPYGLTGGGAISLADLDGDGQPEIVVANAVFNSNGSLRWQAVSGGVGDNWLGPISTVADLDLDGVPEVIAGRTAYRANGTVFWHAAAGDGFNAFGNFDADEFPEVVLVTAGTVYLLEHTGATKWGPISLSGGGNGGPPTVADFDGDGLPEIGVAGAGRYVVFESDGSVRWQVVTSDQTSHVTGSSVFDFDGDGSAEVVYGDEYYLRIYRGTDGAVLYALPKLSATWHEYPVIADVDGDGNAEILAVANGDYFFLFNGVPAGYPLQSSVQNGLVVIGDITDTWVPARPIWNQHTYHVTNINDNGSIPAHEENSWQIHNTYRMNVRTEAFSRFIAPELTASYVRVAQQGGHTTYTVRLGNGGSVHVAPGVMVTFYDGDPRSGGTLFGTVASFGRIDPGSYEDLTFTLSTAATDLWVRADDNGAGLGQVSEGDETNNLYHPDSKIQPGEIRGTVLIDIENDILVTSATTNSVLRFDGTTGAFVGHFVAPGSGGLKEPHHLQFGPDGNLYVSTRANPVGFLRYDGQTGQFIDVFASLPESGLFDSATFESDGKIYVTFFSHDSIVRFDTKTGAFVDTFVSRGTGGLHTPAHLTFGPDGHLYVASRFDVLRYDGVTGQFLGTFIPHGSGGIDRPTGMFFMPDGLLYVADAETSSVYRYDATTGDFHDVFISGSAGYIQEMVFGPDGYLYISDYHGNRVRRFDGRTGAFIDTFVTAINPTSQAFIPDPGLAGWTVYLDHNQNGLRDPGERFTTTDIHGNYAFTDLPPGAYYVTQERRSGWRQTVPPSGVHEAVLTSGQLLVDRDFSNVQDASVNHPPSFSTAAANAAISPGAQLNYDADAVDPDGDPLTFILDTAPAGMTVDANGVVSWTPLSTQVGTHTIALRVNDGRGGEDIQTFTIEVSPAGANRAPQIISSPPTAGIAGRLLAYNAAAFDLDSDAVFWSFDQAPAGMSLDPLRGTVRWLPNAAQLGNHTVILRVTDALGGTTVQTFQIDVRSINTPPLIVSTPPTRATAGQAIAYAVRANDVDGDVLAYAVFGPTGMTIDAAGILRWTTQAANVGSHNLTISVSDGQATTLQTFTLIVSAVAPNRPPVITSDGPYLASVDAPYRYEILAADPEGQPLRYELLEQPTGMAIDINTGLVTWTPTSGQVGEHRVTVAAIDASGAGAVESYILTVFPANRAPTITSTPTASVTAGLSYRYDVRAADPDGDLVSYQLAAAPAGVTIDILGRIRWSTAGVAVGSYPVEVVATDARGASVRQTFNIDVLRDNQPPQANIIASHDEAAPGEQVSLLVQAIDNVGVTHVTLTVDGVPVALDAANRATVPLTRLGLVPAVATAFDAAGNVGTFTWNVLVVDRSDDTAPVAELVTPSDNATLLAPTEIIGTVTDDTLQFYTLAIAPVGSGSFTEIARGTSPVVNGSLGRLDTSTLANDSYILRLTAIDAGGKESADERLIHVAGDLKLGNFALSFTDLSIPVTGIPITVSRSYDSFNAAHSSDFGHGWRMEFRDTDLRTSVEPSGLEEYGVYTPFYVGARVYVTLPGGKREGFTFQPKPAPGIRGSFLRIFEPHFVADEGVTTQLSVPNQDLFIDSGTGEAYSFGGGVPYNPASVLLPSRFYLTTQEGVAYAINATTGDLESIADVNGNTLSFTDAGIISSAGKSVTFERDPQGRITAVVDPAGRKIHYAYDAHGDLVSVTDREGNLTRFIYDEPQRAHFLTEIIDPLGRSGVRSEYDDQGRLVTMRDADGHAVQLVHDPDNSTETVVDQLGNPTTYVYDARGNVVTEINAEGEVTKRTYDSKGNTLTETVVLEDGTELTTSFSYDARRNTLTETDPLGNVTRFAYQTFTFSTAENFARALAGDTHFAAPTLPFSLPTTTVDPLGNVTTNAYDGRGNLLSMTDGAGQTTGISYFSFGLPQSLNMPGGNSTTFEYDFAGNVQSQTDALGNVTSFTYDANGNQLTETRTLTTPAGVRTLVTIREYDPDGRAIKVTDAEGNVSRTEYDAAGNRSAEIDGLGRRTEFRYDQRGQLTETIFPDATPNDLTDNPRTRTEYDAAGRETARIDELGRRTELRYDKVGRLVATIFPDATPADLTDNPRTQTEYDAAGRTTAEIDERGNRTEFEYDLAGRQTEVRDALGRSTFFTYDAAGRQVAVTDALGHTTQTMFDASGRPASTVFEDDTSVASMFDDAGRLSGRTDQLGRTTRYEYDALGRLTAVIDALLQRTEYGYDEAGSLITQEDANDHVTRYEYDGLGRRVATVLPLGERSTTAYDAVGNVASTTDFNGDTIEYHYDARNRLLQKDYPDGSSVSFTYTLTGQRETYTDARGVTRWVYDTRDRLQSRTDPDGTVISYTYDTAGNRTSVTTPAGTVSYTFDALNRMETVTDPEGGLTRYFYDPVGNLIRTEMPNGTSETREHDDLNRLLFLENLGPAGVISSYRYTLAATGRRDAVVEHDGRHVDYTYDPLDRLTRESITDAVLGDRDIAYTYDPVGNRLTRDDSAEGVTSYTYDANDRLLTEELLGELAQYTYDDNGNTLSRISPTERVFYDWDFDNRLIAADTDGDGVKDITNFYDADDIRVTQTVSGEETRLLIDTIQPYQQVKLEYRPSGLVVASYVYGNDLISQDRGSAKSFYHVDGLGSTRGLSDTGGHVTDRYRYDAFGRVLQRTGVTRNEYLFTGEHRDEGIGLDYLRARYVSIDSGRFFSRDSFVAYNYSPASLHRYAYAHGNPITHTDPSGNLIVELVTLLAITAVIGHAVAATPIRGQERINTIIDTVATDPAMSAKLDSVLHGLGAFAGTARNLGYAGLVWLQLLEKEDVDPYICTGIAETAASIINNSPLSHFIVGAIPVSRVKPFHNPTIIAQSLGLPAVVDVHHTATQVIYRDGTSDVFDWHATLDLRNPDFYQDVESFVGDGRLVGRDGTPF